MIDLELQATPKGRKPSFFRELGKGEKRGAKIPFTRFLDRAPHEREVVTTTTNLVAGDEYVNRLRYSVKDFARGAYERSPVIIQGKPFFSGASDALAAADVKQACFIDPCIFRVMIAPFDGEQVVCRQWVRTFMGNVQRAIGTRLFWFAAIHHHPTMLREANRHFHVIIRGQGLNGEVITFNANFARYGFATIASRMITEALGPVPEVEQVRRVAERELMAGKRKSQRAIEHLRKSGADQWIIDSIAHRAGA